MTDLTDALADTQAREAEWRGIAASHGKLETAWREIGTAQHEIAEAWSKLNDAQRSAVSVVSRQMQDAQRTRSHILILVFVIMAISAANLLARS